MATASSSAMERDVGLGSLSIGHVRAVEPDGYLLVESPGSQEAWLCQVLRSGEQWPRIAVGTTVLLAHVYGGTDTIPVVIGEIGVCPSPGHSAELSKPVGEDSLPDTLLLEAKESLTLRVGDGSITIRADGKILIKGKDLVSHAQRVNRIKGGSVAIN